MWDTKILSKLFNQTLWPFIAMLSYHMVNFNFKWTNKERELSYTYNLVKVLPPFDLLSKFKKTLFQIQIQLILTT